MKWKVHGPWKCFIYTYFFQTMRLIYDFLFMQRRKSTPRTSLWFPIWVCRRKNMMVGCVCSRSSPILYSSPVSLIINRIIPFYSFSHSLPLSLSLRDLLQPCFSPKYPAVRDLVWIISLLALVSMYVDCRLFFLSPPLLKLFPLHSVKTYLIRFYQTHPIYFPIGAPPLEPVN